MRDLLRVVSILACIAALLSTPAEAQSDDPIVTWLSLVNEARLDEGLAPYSLSSLLSKAAQRHAEDLAANGFPDPDDVHLGSDGSHEQERIQEAGYAAWTRTGGSMVVDENLWAGTGPPEDAMAFFLDDPVHRANILSERYREIGIGVATDDNDRTFYVLDFGARPNVLPVFINDGAANTENPEVAVRLTNENARPSGEGADKMGRAIEVRLSDDPEFEGESWQAWSPFVSWTLPEETGEHTVYVQFRDAAGRTTSSADTIYLGEGTPTVPTPVTATATATATEEPTETPTSTSTPTATPQPTEPLTVAPSATPTAPSLSPTPGPTPVPPTSTSAPPTLSPTPFPTWTPLPSPTAENEAAQVAGMLPPSAEEPTRASKLVILVAALQGVALILGLSLALRRGGRDESV